MLAQSAVRSVVAHLHILMPAAVRLEAASRQDKHPEAEGKRCARARVSVCVYVSVSEECVYVWVCAVFLSVKIYAAWKLIMWP